MLQADNNKVVEGNNRANKMVQILSKSKMSKNNKFKNLIYMQKFRATKTYLPNFRH